MGAATVVHVKRGNAHDFLAASVAARARRICALLETWRITDSEKHLSKTACSGWPLLAELNCAAQLAELNWLFLAT